MIMQKDQKSAQLALSILGQRLGMDMEEVANKILDISSRKILQTIRILMREYKLKDNKFVLIGGGGGIGPCSNDCKEIGLSI